MRRSESAEIEVGRTLGPFRKQMKQGNLALEVRVREREKKNKERKKDRGNQRAFRPVVLLKQSKKKKKNYLQRHIGSCLKACALELWAVEVWAILPKMLE